MVQRRRGASLALQTGPSLAIGRQVSGQKLQRHQPIERLVPGLVHDTHPAPTDRLDDPVAANDASGGEVLFRMGAEGSREDLSAHLFEEVRGRSV